jgi:hypothetical protein
MAKRRKKKPAVPLVPRLGPPENLRPAGAHKDKRRRSRAEEKAELQRGTTAAGESDPVLYID